MFDLTGKTALVTGASGGIGAAIARALHAQGARVTLSGTRQDALDALADELGAGTGSLACDLAEPAAVAALATDAEAAMGGLDILVNNAGRTLDGLAMRMSDEDWNAIVEINLSAGFRLSRAVLRGMMKRRFGRIINITSIVGQVGSPGQANYVAAKAGLTGMTKSIAAEVASRNITVNCIAPGFIATPMTDALPEDRRTALLTSIPAGRLGRPDDIAAGAVYLASDEAAYVTGATLSINGGMAMI